MDSHSFGMGVFIAAAAIGIAAFVGTVSYSAGRSGVFVDIKHYGCEKMVEINKTEGTR